ncbi:hypothetical protein Hanom_Chr01g00012511 [Helianthus anomalus]
MSFFHLIFCVIFLFEYYLFPSLISTLQHNVKPEAADLLMKVLYFMILETNDSSSHGRILEELWQGHGPGKFFGRSANFRISIEIFYIYYVWPGLFLVSVSFGPGTFNGQDPPLFLAQHLRRYVCFSITNLSYIIHI